MGGRGVEVGVAVEHFVGVGQVAVVGSLGQGLDHVHAEPVDAAVEPEPQRVVHGGHHLRVAPVQVGLLGQEQVQVVLAGRLVERPGGGPGEVADPVVGRTAAGCGVAPDVPVALGVVARRPRLDEPRMLGRRVVGHPVDEHPQAAVVRLGHQRVEVGQRAEDGVDVAVVADVVAVVLHRRPVERRQPEGVDAQPHQVVEMGTDAVEVADPVTVRVGERARIDLVHDRRTPPRLLRTSVGLGHVGHACSLSRRRSGIPTRRYRHRRRRQQPARGTARTARGSRCRRAPSSSPDSMSRTTAWSTPRSWSKS